MGGTLGPPSMSTDGTPRLSACLIVRDEIDGLEACISSIRGVVDEVVIVDTGSTDGTVELARNLADRFAEVEWNDHFADARNSTLALATGDFVLSIDADERLSGGADLLRRCLDDPTLLAADLRVECDLPDGTIGQIWATRLFRRRPDVCWEGRVHEQVGPSVLRIVDAEHAWQTPRLEVSLRHLGYAQGRLERAHRNERNIRLLRMAVEETPESAPPARRAHQLYKLACEMGLRGEGAAALRRAVAIIFEQSHSGRAAIAAAPEVLIAASQVFWARDRDLSLRCIEAAVTLNPTHPMVRLMRARSLLEQGNPQLAIDALSGEPSPGGFHFDLRAFTIAKASVLSQAYADLGENGSARQCLRKAIAQEPDHSALLSRLIYVEARCVSAVEAIRLGVESMKRIGPDPQILSALADVAEEAGYTQKASIWRRLSAQQRS